MVPDLSTAVWRKSSRSTHSGQYVEVAPNLPGVAAVRDSKNPTGPVLLLSPNSFASLIETVRSGRLDLA